MISMVYVLSANDTNAASRNMSFKKCTPGDRIIYFPI